MSASLYEAKLFTAAAANCSIPIETSCSPQSFSPLLFLFLRAGFYRSFCREALKARCKHHIAPLISASFDFHRAQIGSRGCVEEAREVFMLRVFCLFVKSSRI